MASPSTSYSKQEESAEERCLMSLLSDDALVVVLRKLSTRELLISVAFVCKRWHRLCKEYLVHELVPSPFNIGDRPWGNMSDKDIYDLAVSCSSSVERISFHGLKRLNPSLYIIPLFATLPKLKDLAIISCPLESADLEAIASQLPTQLTSLDIHSDHFARVRCYDCTVPPSEDNIVSAIHQRCFQLQRLNLDSCSNISMQGLEKLLQANQFLTSLDLHSHALGWPELAQIFQICKSLRHFSLVSPLLVESYSNSEDDREDGSFRRRYIRRGDGQTAPVRIEFPRNLTSLRLYSSPHRSIHLEMAGPVMECLRQSGMQLTHLHAQRVYNTTWQTIQTWCPNLKMLDLSHCKHELITLTGVESLVLCGLIKMLKKVEFIALPAATDVILKQLGDYCPKLRELRFEGFGQNTSPNYFLGVTDTGVVALAEGCPELRALSLAGCRRITIRSIRTIAFHCRQLKVLILSHCRGIKDDAVALMMPRLSTSLVFLDLVGCKVTLLSLQTILQYARVTTLRVVVVKLPANKIEALSNQTSHPRLQFKASTSSTRWDGFYNAVQYE
ncbi:hypothetical protein R1sor_017930 [Riccia sorocarpa]|uniref:F-box domain-containing protein n=1 Tax=Riccia sorocarpa TaxID=122646 RepID=A0ABD3I8C4_9MARC